MRYLYLYITIAFLSLTSVAYSQASGSIQPLQDDFQHLKSMNGHLFFPVEYAHLRNELSALEKIAASSHWNAWRDSYESLEKDIQLWLANTTQVQTNSATALDARTDAILLKAEQFAEETFLKGDKQLQRAAAFMAKGNLSRADKHVDNARVFYKRAELEAVRNNLIGEVRILIHESLDLKADELAPKAYSTASQLLEETEQLVRLGKTSEIDISDQSKRLVRAANILLQRVQTIQPLYKVKSNIEVFLAKLENDLNTVAEELNLFPENSSDVDDLLQEIHAAAKSLNSEKALLIERTRKLEEQKEVLERELAQYRDQARLRQERQVRINKVKSSLQQHVLQDGNILTVILDSLAFNDESYTLTPQQRSRLNTVSHALQDLSIKSLEVRYVSYTPENAALHQHLATQRAEAISEHLRE
ncbi:MAG: hypothetical protein AAFP70_06210, partial [Calditrichota bacterium]